jgi:fumarate hydratase subunit alpha
VRLTLASKGFGAENMSGQDVRARDGVRRSGVVLETVEQAGANACPPIIVGVGVAARSRRRRCSPAGGAVGPMCGTRARLGDLERAAGRRERLGNRPQGFGGLVTALG